MSSKDAGTPDFEQTVKVILATFTVFTGFAIGKAVEAVAGRIPIPQPDVSFSSPLLALWTFVCSVVGEPYFWALIALLALMLRFVIGSAIHLNDTYVKRAGQPQVPVSRIFSFLFKDLMFLVLFGIVALFIAKTVTIDKTISQQAPFDVTEFALGSMLFLLCGLLWSVVDIIVRRLAGGDEWPGIEVYWIWPLLDTTQFFITWLVVWGIAPSKDLGVLPQLIVLALVYVVCLFIDIGTLISGLQARAAAAKAPRTMEITVTAEMIAAANRFMEQARPHQSRPDKPA